MRKDIAVQLFAILAVLVGLLVSYHPPPVNATEIWALVSFFLGVAIRELFGITPTPPAVTPSPAPETEVGK